MGDMRDQYEDGRYDGSGIDKLPVGRKEPSDADARRAALEGIAKLQQFIAELDAKASAIPPEPHGDDQRFSVLVRFKQPGSRKIAPKTYEFLILQTPGGYYTTGGDSGYYPTWEALVRWLRGPRVAWHSAVRPLRINDTTAPVMKASDE